MKFLLTLVSVSIFAGAALAHPGYVRPGYPPPYHHHDDDIALFATTGALLLVTSSHAEAQARYSLMVEASQLAPAFLATGQGLDNPALVAAMIVVQNGDKSLSNDELALRVIEEANR